jgi:hypothetical protein
VLSDNASGSPTPPRFYVIHVKAAKKAKKAKKKKHKRHARKAQKRKASRHAKAIQLGARFTG